jgi:hypothetical protein
MSTKQHALDTMNFAHGMLNKMLDGIPADKAAYQIHATSNHVLWTLGHLAATYAWFVSAVDPGKTPKLPESYLTLFGGGTKPNPVASTYPALAEVRAAYDGAYSALAGVIGAINEKDLWSACATETGGFLSSKIDTAYKCAWHDGWHIGQIADLRRALGLPPVM